MSEYRQFTTLEAQKNKTESQPQGKLWVCPLLMDSQSALIRNNCDLQGNSYLEKDVKAREAMVCFIEKENSTANLSPWQQPSKRGSSEGHQGADTERETVVQQRRIATRH